MTIPTAATTATLSRIVLMVRGSEGLAAAVHFYHHAVGLRLLRVTDEWAELSAASAMSNNNNNNFTGRGSDSKDATASHNNNNTITANSAGGVILNLQAVTAHEAHLSTSYSPWLTFTVQNMDEKIVACVQAGAHLDGPIQYPAHGKVALLRSPDQHMIGFYEPNHTF